MKKRLLIIFIVIISLFSFNNSSISSVVGNKIFKSNSNYNKMKINYINIKSRSTGTAPFNNGTSSNEYGFDVSDEDDYVRTFDSIKYVLELGITPNTNVDGVTSSSIFKGGIIKIKAKLPNQGDNILMTFEEDAWMKNVSFNSDKTEVYAEYIISDRTSISNANQFISFTVKVNGYKKDITSDMKPVFSAWMDGNEEDLIASCRDEDNLIISAKPSYDVDLKASTYLYTGSMNDVAGEYVSYGVGVALIQPYSGINDLRGVELPTGKFEIDIDNCLTASSTNSDYFNIDNSNSSLVAYSLNYENNDFYYKNKKIYTRTLPKGIGGGERGVTSSGDINVTLNSNTTTISFDNYVIDNHYPIKTIIELASKTTYKNNLGYIMAGNLQLFIPFYDFESINSYNYKLNSNVSKIRYYDSNNNLYEINGSNEKKTSNNKITIDYYKKNNGKFYTASRLSNNNTSMVDGRASAYSGEYINPAFTLMPYTGPYDKSERLIIWNTKYFEITKKNKNNFVGVTCTSEIGIDCPSDNTITFKYGVYKLNKNIGIDSDELVNSTYFNDFDWYDTPEEAINNGKITAIYALDNEVVGQRVHRIINPKFKVTEDKDLIGKVGMIIQRNRIYDEDIVYEPYKNDKYSKTVYSNNGDIVKEHSLLNLGLSVLILGEKANVESNITDIDLDGNIKSNYNVNDKVINMKITPSVINNNINGDRVVDSIIIKTTLPGELDYKDGSSNKEVKDIIYNSDGSTTIVWEYNNYVVNSVVPDITYSVEINSSIKNNTYLDINTVIYDKYDLRDIKYRSCSNRVYVSNLSGSMTARSIDKTVLDIGDDFVITNVVGNISESVLEDIMTYEVLPVGDYKINVLELGTNQKIYYTTVSVDEININDESIWTEVVLGEDIVGATAILSKIDSINGNEEVTFKYNILTGTNQLNDIYSFSMNVYSPNFSNSMKSNTVTAEVVERVISGTAFIDMNGNSLYDSDDEILGNITVNLYNENNELIGTTVTDSNGNYTFGGLVKGNYYVTFILPDGYDYIDNGVTDIINHNNERSINNVLLGVKKKVINNTNEPNIINNSNNTSSSNITRNVRRYNNNISNNIESTDNSDNTNKEVIDSNKENNNEEDVEDKYQFKETIEGMYRTCEYLLCDRVIMILFALYSFVIFFVRRGETK